MQDILNTIISPETQALIGQIALLGTIASIIVQALKQAVGSRPLLLNTFLVIISLAGAILYGVLQKYGLLSGTLAIFAAASTIHNVFIRIAEKKVAEIKAKR